MIKDIYIVYLYKTVYEYILNIYFWHVLKDGCYELLRTALLNRSS